MNNPSKTQLALHLVEVIHDLEAMHLTLGQDHDCLGIKELSEAISRLERVKGQLSASPVPATEHVDLYRDINKRWVVRVFREVVRGHRGPIAISRTFLSETAARVFYEKTQPVHQQKANRGESRSYLIVLAHQDVRDWLKDRQWTELEHVDINAVR